MIRVTYALGLAGVFGLLAVLAACQGHRQAQKQGQPAEPETSRTQADTAADSIRHPDPGPSPNAVRVRARVRSCQEEETGFHCKLNVQRVLGRGSATPALGTGAIRVRADWFDDPQERKTLEKYQDGRELEVTLSHSEQPTGGDASRSPWRLLEIH